MKIITPTVAAELANEVYKVRHDKTLKGFLSNKIFTANPKNKTALKAEIGGRIINVSDGFAVCARGGKEHETDLFLIFRGTDRAADYFTDARIGVERSVTGIPVHMGFNQVFKSLLTQLRTFVTLNRTGITRIICIGHSLGGAIATLAAEWVKSHTALTVQLYTFGCPRVGFDFFSTIVTTKLKATNIYRVYNESDPVPMVPVFPFTHAPTLPGQGYVVTSTGAMLSFSAHYMKTYIEMVKQQTWDKLKRPCPLSSSEQAIQRWLASDAPVSPLNPQTWAFINAGLQWVLQSIMSGAIMVLQLSVMSLFTLADKIAWILLKGIDLAKEASVWVLRLMRKIMQVLGMKIVKSVEQLTRSFMRAILERLMRKITEEAARAVRGISG